MKKLRSKFSMFWRSKKPVAILPCDRYIIHKENIEPPKLPCDRKRETSRVTLLGAHSKMGHVLALLMKDSPLISSIHMYDTSENLHNVADDINQIDSFCRVIAHVGGMQSLYRSLQNADIIVILQSRGVYEPDPVKCLIKYGDKIVNYSQAIARVNPKAFVIVAHYPIESFVAVVSTVLKKEGIYNPLHVIGSCALSEVIANTNIARALDLDPFSISVPLIGGTSTDMLVPIFSHALPAIPLTKELLHEILEDLRRPFTSASTPSVPLLEAHALKRLIVSVAAGSATEKNILISAFVRTEDLTCSKYLASPILLGPSGVETILNIPKLSDFELNELSVILTRINELAVKGEEYAENHVSLKDDPDSMFNPNVLEGILKARGLMNKADPVQSDTN